MIKLLWGVGGGGVGGESGQEAGKVITMTCKVFTGPFLPQPFLMINSTGKRRLGKRIFAFQACSASMPSTHYHAAPETHQLSR